MTHLCADIETPGPFMARTCLLCKAGLLLTLCNQKGWLGRGPGRGPGIRAYCALGASRDVSAAICAGSGPGVPCRASRNA